MKRNRRDVDRRSPKQGYDFKEKSKYRKRVWEFFSTTVKDTCTAKVAFFPSTEGLEIPVALKLGFRECNLYAIDDNPAVMATAAWRKKYPQVQVYASEVGRAAQRLVTDGVKLDAVNFDLCGTLSNRHVKSCTTFVTSGVLSSTCAISHTMLKGRETSETFGMLEILGELLFPENVGIDKIPRQKIFEKLVYQEYDGSFHTRYVHEYRSGPSTMIYFMGEAVGREELERRAEEELTLAALELTERFNDFGEKEKQMETLINELERTRGPEKRFPILNRISTTQKSMVEMKREAMLYIYSYPKNIQYMYGGIFFPGVKVRVKVPGLHDVFTWRPTRGF